MTILVMLLLGLTIGLLAIGVFVGGIFLAAKTFACRWARSLIGLAVAVAVFLTVGLLAFESRSGDSTAHAAEEIAPATYTRSEQSEPPVVAPATGENLKKDTQAAPAAEEVVAEAEVPEEIADKLGPRERPDWLDQEAYTEDNIYYLPVATGRYSTPEECRAVLEPTIVRELNDYYRDRHQSLAGTIDPDDDFVHNQLVSETYIEEVYSKALDRSMYRAHVLLKFDTDVDAHVQELARQATVEHRLFTIGIGAGAVMLLLAGAWGLLKILPGGRSQTTQAA